PASKISLSGEHDTKAKSPIKQERPASPVPSCVSMKSDRSMGQPITSERETFLVNKETNRRDQSQRFSVVSLPRVIKQTWPPYSVCLKRIL
ncbi:hypothetical protein J4Q44_G00380570, partial [Coregonus suidteri]